MSLFSWSQTSSSNASADATINWREGQAPSTINDSARAMMSATAKWRDDIAGAIVTAGTSTAYTVASYSSFDTLAHLNGQVIAFSPHATNGAGPVTLNVDGLGNKALRSAPNVELLAGTLIQGTPYVAVYNNTDGAFYLQGFYGNPYNVPLAAGMDYWGSTAPNSSFAFPAGQAISRTTYATLFAIMGTTYGSGDGSTTFNLPNKAGRVSAMIESAATLLTATYFGGNSTTLGATGGVESHTLTDSEGPVHSHGVTDNGHIHTGFGHTQGNGSGTTVTQNAAQGSNNTGESDSQNLTINSATTGISIQNAGGGAAHNNVQPTIMCNYIIRIL